MHTDTVWDDTMHRYKGLRRVKCQEGRVEKGNWEK